MADETKEFWTTLVQTLGFPIVAAGILAWFAYTTVNWEREQMLPTIQQNTTALNNTTKTLEIALEMLEQKEKK